VLDYPNLFNKELTPYKHNKVVGIVSQILSSKSDNGFDLIPASLDSLKEVLKKIPS
jgi:hypothetical protein